MVFFGRERLTAELAGKIAGTPIVMVTGASGAGKTSLLQAGLVAALARGVQVPGSSSWPVVSLSATARPLTDLAAGLASLGGREPAAIRQMLADAPGEAHLLIREIMLAAGDPARLVLIIDQFEQVFAADGPDGRLERAAFIDAVCAAATQPAGLRGRASGPGSDRGPRGLLGPVRRLSRSLCGPWSRISSWSARCRKRACAARSAGRPRRAGCALMALSSTPSWPMCTRRAPGRARRSRCSPRPWR